MPSRSVLPGEVTVLLKRWTSGDDRALQALIPLVCGRLRAVAKRLVSGERPGHILQPTAVVNEAYVRLAAAGKVASDNRNHFFALSAHVMRCILIDYARQQQRRERNGGAQIVWLENVLLSASKNPEHVLSFDEALTRLSKEHPRKGRLVELHSFGGLRLAEAAQFLQVFENTAQRDLKFTKAWMSRELGQHEAQ